MLNGETKSGGPANFTGFAGGPAVEVTVEVMIQKQSALVWRGFQGEETVDGVLCVLDGAAMRAINGSNDKLSGEHTLITP